MADQADLARAAVKLAGQAMILLRARMRGGTKVPHSADYRRGLSSRPAALDLRGTLFRPKVRLAPGCEVTP